ncbi:MAG: archaeal proteasome endopeptidase complex subunit alpha [Candidatus Sigynarchaeota archaeon]
MFSAPGVGYDRGITTFSPDGRLFQVEYAIEAVRKGTTALGLICKDGVVLTVEKRVQPLQEPSHIQKIFKINKQIAACISGLTADARVLIDQARIKSEVHTLSYDEPITVEAVTQEICDLKQLYTQNAGVRPFGVSLLIGGLDPTGECRLYVTDPSGAYLAYYAIAIGVGEQDAKDFLEKNYNPSIDLEAAKILSIKTLIKVVEGDLDNEKVDMVVISKEKGSMEFISDKELNAILATKEIQEFKASLKRSTPEK